MILFEDARLPHSGSRFLAPERRAGVRLDGLADWPPHMRLEFALLAAERGLSDEELCDRTGLPASAFRRLRQSGCTPYARNFSEARELDALDPTIVVARRVAASREARDA